MRALSAEEADVLRWLSGPTEETVRDAPMGRDAAVAGLSRLTARGCARRYEDWSITDPTQKVGTFEITDLGRLALRVAVPLPSLGSAS